MPDPAQQEAEQIVHEWLKEGFGTWFSDNEHKKLVQKIAIALHQATQRAAARTWEAAATAVVHSSSRQCLCGCLKIVEDFRRRATEEGG